VTIFGWQGVSSLLSMGLSVWQAIVCNFVAKLIQIVIVISLGWYASSLFFHVIFEITERPDPLGEITGSVQSGTLDLL
jgi:cytosine/uracil/thiamine/allantoin permease